MDEIGARAARLDAADPLAAFPSRFLTPNDGSLQAYLDGNSLGRPLIAAQQEVEAFLTGPWGTRLIRGWTDEWMEWPVIIGDELAAAALGAAPGQTIIADSTSVMLYKLARAALSMADGRDELIVDTDNFPTDRYLVEGIAAELGCTLRWVETPTDGGLSVDAIDAMASDRTALLLASQVAYRSGFLADVVAITERVHRAGGKVVWDLSHSVGSVPVKLDEWGVDFAAGCGYKYLNGGPGAPAFGYVARHLRDQARQPIQGWMGHATPFEMGPGYEAHQGIRGYLTGTPPILGMVPLREGIRAVAEAGIDNIRTKSLRLTDFALDLADAWLVPHGVRIASPREPDRRGGHITICRSDFAEVNAHLWERGVIGDFRAPDGIRLGLAPLSTTFTEVLLAMEELRALLAG